MFILTRRHESAFNDASYARFRERLLRRLRVWHTLDVAMMDDDRLRAFILDNCELARAHGLRSRRQLDLLVRASALLAPHNVGPRTVPAIMRILKDTSAAADTRAERIYELAVRTGSSRT